MGDVRAGFMAQVAGLTAAARRDLVIRRLLAGLFLGLLPALGIAAMAGTIALPVPAWSLAAAAVIAGLAAGGISALLARPDPMGLLIRADAVTGSKELASTALELARSEEAQSARFTDAILEDASQLLAGTNPRAILSPPRLTLAPFAAFAASLAVAALLFPVDLRQIFPVPTDRDREMGRIGDELRERGEKLAERAQSQGLDRSIELSRQLAQLGRDLAARKVTPQEARDRLSELESGFREEYQLRLQQMQLTPPGVPGSGTSRSGSRELSTETQGKGGMTGEAPRDSTGEREGDGAARDLADTLDKLRQAQRDLGGPGSAQDRDQGGDKGADKNGGAGNAQGDQAQGSPGQDRSPGRAGKSESADKPGGPGGGGIGRDPAAEKRGPASPIIPGDKGPNLQAPGNAAGEDSIRLLARTLPEWSGLRLPEKTILNEYSRQAESALAHDEVPLKLRQSVKKYFSVIGISR